MSNQPVVWTIAGSDSGGGAGIQADLKTMNGLGVYSASVITAVTAQNTLGVEHIEPVQLKAIKAQLDCLKSDMPPHAVKLGMLYSAQCVEAIAAVLDGLKSHVVCDPVLVATSGDELYEAALLAKMKDRLFPLVDLLTPNLSEAHLLLGRSIDRLRGLQNQEERDHCVQDLADKLLGLGPKSVLIKGGDEAGEYSQDFWTDGREKAWLTSFRQVTRNTHGTGCTLASAVAACLALGYSMLDSLAIAKAYVNQGLRLSPGVGKGQGPLAHLAWPENQDDMPWLTKEAAEGRNRLEFPDCDHEPIGFYPIVESAERVARLARQGVKTIQLRLKNVSERVFEQETITAIQAAKESNSRLFINDYWQLAIKHQAYGVHLGQEDLDCADPSAIAEAGLRLGVSTHNYAEVARALALRPSYIAIGPIFATNSKRVDALPHGLAALRRWRRTLKYPLVAIGGINLQNAEEVIAAGADGVAVIKGIAIHADGEASVNEWLKLFRHAAAHSKTLSPRVRGGC
jgi:hydroxymethylpyrimidine kinase/phosphomethylpyrimidine kinase/thiamine-phosphate diphosphorylase